MESENQTFALRLAAIGYPGYGYLRRPRQSGETSMKVLLGVLSCTDPEPRLIEALPWIILRHWRTDFSLLIEEAETLHVQNQLGFLVSIARRISQTTSNRIRTEVLQNRMKPN